ncbi:MAG: hypothetical protein JRN15_21985 [Nitrososphaerota archaeon]|nr:hypothetical protein [Nitrososphaerota archaeon]
MSDLLSLDEQYSCRFCNFVERTLGFEDLSEEDEEDYVVHLKTVHGLSK